MSSKPSDDETPPTPKSYIEFRVQLKRKEMQDLLAEVDQLETKKLRNVQLLEQLKSEQDNQMRQLLRRVKEQEKNLEQKELALVRQVGETRDATLAKKAEMEDFQRKLGEVERCVSGRRAECQQLRDYRDVGVHEHQAQITRLEEERERMQLEADTAAEHMRSQLALTLRLIDEGTARALEENRLAQEMKMKELKMDDSYKEAHKENKWLKEKVSAYRAEVSALELSVHSVEVENVAHGDWLFDQHLKLLSISRKNPTAGPGSDLHKISVVRPTSVAGCSAGAASGHLDGDEMDGSCSGSATPSDQLRPRHNLSVGELQQRLLTVVGQAVPLHLPPTGEDHQWDPPPGEDHQWDPPPGEDHQWDDAVTRSSVEEVATIPLTSRRP